LEEVSSAKDMDSGKILAIGLSFRGYLGAMGRKRLFNDKEKWCSKCSKWLPLNDFWANSNTLSGRQDYCKTCHDPYIDHSYEKQVLQKRNLSVADYTQLWEVQDRRCAICGLPIVLCTQNEQGTKASLDHNHTTDQVRGLLCQPCNHGLGSFKDSIPNLERAIAYLKNPPAGVSCGA